MIWKVSADEPLHVSHLICVFAVLRRIKVTFIDTIVRIEHQPRDLETGVALEVHIKRYVSLRKTHFSKGEQHDHIMNDCSSLVKSVFYFVFYRIFGDDFGRNVYLINVL